MEGGVGNSWVCGRGWTRSCFDVFEKQFITPVRVDKSIHWTHFEQMFQFFTPWKTTEHNTYDFMIFSVDRKLKYCLKMSPCISVDRKLKYCLKMSPCTVCYIFLFSTYIIYSFSSFKLSKIYTHQVLIYLDVPEIPVKEPLQNS